MTIGERISKRRQELGLTVDEVAEQLNKSRATVYRYENGEIEKLPTTVLEPLAKLLRTTPAYLMGWVDDAEAPLSDDTKKQPVPELSETDPVEKIVKQLTAKLMQLDDTRLLELNDYLSYLEWKMQKERQKK